MAGGSVWRGEFPSAASETLGLHSVLTPVSHLALVRPPDLSREFSHLNNGDITLHPAPAEVRGEMVVAISVTLLHGKGPPCLLKTLGKMIMLQDAGLCLAPMEAILGGVVTKKHKAGNLDNHR